MRDRIFSGTAVAIVTPFKGTGIHTPVDYARLEQLIERQIQAGSDALVICGTTGEASAMPDADHVAVVAAAVKTVAGRIPVIAGAGSNDTVHAIDLARMCEAAGADALLCVTPYYNKTSQAGLVEHFRIAAQATGLPVILYNVPSRTNLNIQPETYARLAEVPNIVGTKECNLAQVAETRRLCGPDFLHYSGEDGLVLSMMALGASGVISVVANLVPERMRELTHAFLEGDISRATEIQIGLETLVRACFSDVNPIPVKEGLRLMGLDAGPCRLPLVALSEPNRLRLAAELDRLGLLADEYRYLLHD
ncbi:MAG: 4-hydroxy-tetrahydrodipicolinate synthase [Bacillota bacterium]|nr:4-hydroxy-tetrahydrodipicolinate synthase [Bacillota bacterium]